MENPESNHVFRPDHHLGVKCSAHSVQLPSPHIFIAIPQRIVNLHIREGEQTINIEVWIDLKCFNTLIFLRQREITHQIELALS